ncbi:MAG: DnaD domain-containing protein [Bacillota bacterium]|jgi:DNA replication protein
MNAENKKIFLNILTDGSSVPNTLLDHYRDMGLTEAETLFLIVLLRLKNKKSVLTFKNTARESVYSEEEVMTLVPVLIDKGFLSLSGEGDILLDGLVEKFLEVHSWEAVKAEQKIRKERKTSRVDQAFADLYQRFEEEMGRPLSPIEGEQISYWYKKRKIPAELIKAGLTRAVLLGKYNLRYIEAILDSWQRQGIRTCAELEAMEKAEKERRGGRTAPNGGQRSFRGEQKKEDIYTDDIYEVF